MIRVLKRLLGRARPVDVNSLEQAVQTARRREHAERRLAALTQQERLILRR